ncbi:cobalt-precorrin-6A reductase [Rhizobium sp. G187]|uniref:cobalt-precorrin-6A reductase n=1 Tax=Rhizobium sp. G187 TaxID=3451352 RepID=UPI003EE5F55B
MPPDSAMPAERILILGGTEEARRLASELVIEGHHVVTSLAGRTMEPVLPPGEVRIGGFGGIDGLVEYLTAEQFDRVIDATHPFAHRISANAARATAIAGIPLRRLQRPAWIRRPGDLWTAVGNLEAAADALPQGATVFLALGRQYLDAFLPRSDCQFVIRMVDPPTQPLGFTHYTLMLGKPSGDASEEASLLRRFGVTHLVCRNSGGMTGYAKLEAARNLAIPVIMLERD